jgi:hypothetical protein
MEKNKMKKNKSKILIFTMLFAVIILSMLSMQFAYAAQLPVDLGTADDFVILSKAGISTTGITTTIGDIGVSPIDSTAITGFGLIMDASNEFSSSSLVTGKVYAADYTSPTPNKMTTAVSDMETAYTDAAGRTETSIVTELGAGDISGLTIAPGLYKWSTGVLISAGGVTLSGSSNDIWIFQITQDLTVANGAIITLSGGAQPKNIFWQVAGQTTLGTTSDFKGIILCQTLIEMQTGATLNGRALAQTAVTLDANTISLPILLVETPVLTTITLLPATTNLSIGSTIQLNATGLDQNDNPIDAIINYTTSNSSIATVDANGLVTAVDLGSITITATSEDISATSIIIVETVVIPPVVENPPQGGNGGGSGGYSSYLKSETVTEFPPLTEKPIFGYPDCNSVNDCFQGEVCKWDRGEFYLQCQSVQGISEGSGDSKNKEGINPTGGNLITGQVVGGQSGDKPSWRENFLAWFLGLFRRN